MQNFDSCKFVLTVSAGIHKQRTKLNCGTEPNRSLAWLNGVAFSEKKIIKRGEEKTGEYF